MSSESVCCYEIPVADGLLSLSVQRDADDHYDGPMTYIRLLRKLAERLDGIDVSEYEEGDVLALPQPQAELLIAEGWALPAGAFEVRRSTIAERHIAADRPPRRRSRHRPTQKEK
jgi:hypothetical protein